MIYQITRTTLNGYMHENSAFPALIKIFIDRYIKSLDHVWIRNSIIEAKYNTLKEVSMNRKGCESEVRSRFLKRHHVITHDEVFQRIVEPQSLAHKRKIRKGHKDDVRSNSLSNEEDIVPIDDPQSSDGPMKLLHSASILVRILRGENFWLGSRIGSVLPPTYLGA